VKLNLISRLLNTMMGRPQVSREQRLARALRKYREQGHDVYLPGDVKNEEQHEVVVPDKDDLLELSHNKNSDEAIS
jgi:hypothetical protein